MKTNESYSPLYIPPSREVENVNGIFYDLIDIRKKYTKNFLICHLNINSMRYKFDEIKELLFDKVVDCLIVSETKIDSTFKDSLFEVDGYKLQRRDRTDDSVLKICQNVGHFVGHVVEKKLKKNLNHVIIGIFCAFRQV
jgi:hypothetical protein